MFVLMVAVVPPLLSDAPKLAERAGFGDRFRYWRGRSGRRYLFTAVPPDDLDDFRSAVVILAGRRGRGGWRPAGSTPSTPEGASSIAGADRFGQCGPAR